MFINQLLPAVQFHDHGKVIESLHQSLYLKSVDQKYCDQNPLFSDLVQKCILQIKLVFANQDMPLHSIISRSPPGAIPSLYSTLSPIVLP